MKPAERPPLRLRLLYRAAGIRLPSRYRTWVHADIYSRWWPVKQSVRGTVVLLGPMLCYGLVEGGRLSQAEVAMIALLGAMGVLGGALLTGRYYRDRAWRYQDEASRMIPPRLRS